MHIHVFVSRPIPCSHPPPSCWQASCCRITSCTVCLNAYFCVVLHASSFSLSVWNHDHVQGVKNQTNINDCVYIDQFSVLEQTRCAHVACGSEWMIIYWAIQAGLLTPLTFARHRLSPLAAFTSSAYFLHNGRWWQWICEFYFGGP